MVSGFIDKHFFLCFVQQEDRSAKLVEDQPPGNLPYLKPDDVQYFVKLLVSLSIQNSLVNSLSYYVHVNCCCG